MLLKGAVDTVGDMVGGYSGYNPVANQYYGPGEQQGAMWRTVSTLGLTAVPEIQGVFGKTAGQTTDVAGLFRRTENVGDFADLKVPMQMRYVEQAAEDGGVGLQGVKVRIVRDPDLIGKNLYGYTHPNGSIDLYPDAFTDTEQLVKTLGHERTHTMQIDIFGHPNTYGDGTMRQLMLNENAAHGIENSFWQYYPQNNSGKLEQFR
ncbi:hypothetical protein ACKI2N_032120 [Cupriavidus sp. 30B13]|uniref:hypothetical protein n=1 Tax=Cupriavidus sp. 30B13 TaxID=3384241 RepID=UPI003B8FA869